MTNGHLPNIIPNDVNCLASRNSDRAQTPLTASVWSVLAKYSRSQLFSFQPRFTFYASCRGGRQMCVRIQDSDGRVNRKWISPAVWWLWMPFVCLTFDNYLMPSVPFKSKLFKKKWLQPELRLLSFFFLPPFNASMKAKPCEWKEADPKGRMFSATSCL